MTSCFGMEDDLELPCSCHPGDPGLKYYTQNCLGPCTMIFGYLAPQGNGVFPIRGPSRGAARDVAFFFGGGRGRLCPVKRADQEPGHRYRLPCGPERASRALGGRFKEDPPVRAHKGTLSLGNPCRHIRCHFAWVLLARETSCFGVSLLYVGFWLGKFLSRPKEEPR